MSVSFMKRFRKDAPQMDVPEFPVFSHEITEQHFEYAARVLEFTPGEFIREFIKEDRRLEGNMATDDVAGTWVKVNVTLWAFDTVNIVDGNAATNYQFFLVGMSERLPQPEKMTIREYQANCIIANRLINKSLTMDCLYPGVYREVK